MRYGQMGSDNAEGSESLGLGQWEYAEEPGPKPGLKG